MNQATEEFILVDNSIELSIPDGMTLMSESQNTKYEWKDSICGQQEWTLSWILRGDREGDYVISADYAGTLSSFDAEVNATFEPLTSNLPSALKSMDWPSAAPTG